MYKIQVIKPKKTIELMFRNKKNPRGRYMAEIYDGTGRDTSIVFDKVKTLVPSTLLSRWANFHLAHELLTLAGKGSSVEYINYDEGKENTWKYRDEVTHFGLHDVVTRKGVVRAVKIDDSIGMKKVVEILSALGYYVETEFDEKSRRITKITLEKES